MANDRVRCFVGGKEQAFILNFPRHRYSKDCFDFYSFWNRNKTICYRVTHRVTFVREKKGKENISAVPNSLFAV